MSSIEALTITALGLGVVFTGLVLCVVFILLLERVARRIAWDGLAVHGTVAPHRVPERLAEPTPPQPIPPEVRAVIVAVLEVERALYVGRYRSRLTLTRPPVPLSAGDRP